MEPSRPHDLFADLVRAETAPQRQPVPVRAAPVARPRTPVGRRLLGILALLVLTAISLPVHLLAVFFVYVEFESPGDPTTSSLLVLAAAAGSFLALLVTGTMAQLVGGYPGRWRARVTFAACSAVLAIASTYGAALTLF